MWNKTRLIDGGGVLTDGRYAKFWLSQACLYYLYLAWRGQKGKSNLTCKQIYGFTNHKDTRN